MPLSSFLIPIFAFLLSLSATFPLPQSSALCFVTSMHGSTVSPTVCWEAFHPVSPVNLDLCDYVCLCVSTELGLCVCVCLCQNVLDLFSLSFSASRFPSCHSNLSELHQCPTFPALMGTFFPCTFSASVCLKCCLCYLADRFVQGRTAKKCIFPPSSNWLL